MRAELRGVDSLVCLVKEETARVMAMNRKHGQLGKCQTLGAHNAAFWIERPWVAECCWSFGTIVCHTDFGISRPRSPKLQFEN